MKVFALFIVLSIQPAYSQAIKVPVGKNYFLYHKVPPTILGTSCKYGIDTCHFWLISHVGEHEIQSVPYTNIPFFQVNGDYFFSADTLLSFQDTIEHYFGFGGITGPCQGDGCRSFTTQDIWSFQSYFDSTIKLSWYGPGEHKFYANDSVYLGLWAQSHLRLFNNLSDTLYCDSVVISISDSSQLRLAISPATLSTGNFKVLPFDRALLTLSFATAAHPFEEEKIFTATVKLFAHNSQADTLLKAPIRFIYEGHSKGSVPLVNVLPTGITATAIANGEMNVCFHLHTPGNCNFTLYDNLGRTVKALANGFLAEGRHSFEIKLIPGLYFAKLEANGSTVVQKFLVF